MTDMPWLRAVADRPRVLVAEDDRTIAYALERFLQVLNIDVRTTESGTSVVRLACEARPQVLVMDVMMPGLSGETVAGLIRSDPSLQSTRIILFSAIDESELARLAARCGADRHVPKSAGILPLRAAIIELLCQSWRASR